MVLARLIGGEPRPAIARRSGISARTLERTILSLQEKLEAASLAELGYAAAQAGIGPYCVIHF
jgi:FixJ family two-component response regulator